MCGLTSQVGLVRLYAMSEARRSAYVTTSQPSAWVSSITPVSDWTAEVVGDESGWELVARWWGYADDPPGRRAPREVVIRATDALAPNAITGVSGRARGGDGTGCGECRRRGERGYCDLLHPGLVDVGRRYQVPCRSNNT